MQLIHEGSGIVVKCQETRSRSQNRIIARNLLANKLDVIEKGPMSRQQQLIDRKIAAKRSATKKARRKVADKSKPEGSLLNPFQDEFQDSNGVWVNAVVTEDDMKGHKLDPKRRINITTKEGKARPWDTEKPGMIEIEIEGGAKGGVLTGLDETKVIVAYQGLSGAEVDENGNVMESLHEHQVDENGNVTRYARTPLDISKWAPVGEEDIVPPKSSHVVPTRPRRKSVAFGHKREG